MNLEVKVLATKVDGILTLGKILMILTLTSLGSSIWWGATLAADVKKMSAKMGERFAASEKRFDKIEAILAKILEPKKEPIK